MKHFLKAALLGAAFLPMGAMAQPTFNGEAILGYGSIGGEGSGYGEFSLTAKDTFTLSDGSTLEVQARARARTFDNDTGSIDDEAFDFAMRLDAGALGKFEVTTYHDLGQKPWADGELYNRGSVAVFPGIRPRYNDLSDNVAVVGPSGILKADADVLVKYSNRFGKLGLDVDINPLKSYDGIETTLGDEPFAQAKMTLPTKFGIYSVKVNDLNDYLLSVVYPVPKAGVTFIANRQVNEGMWKDYKNEFIVSYNAKDMGLFKGAFGIYAEDPVENIAVLSLNFGNDVWDLKVAGDTHRNVAVEGSYKLAQGVTLLAGYDNGHEFLEGFDDTRNPPVFAPARDEAFEFAAKFEF